MFKNRKSLLFFLVVLAAVVAVKMTCGREAPRESGNERGVTPLSTPATSLDVPPTPEEEAWVEEHVRGNWDAIERGYPIESVQREFVHVLDRIRSRAVVPNISIADNAASPNVNCSADITPDGRHRMTFHLRALQRIHAAVSSSTFQDILIDCMVHENIHLEEQMLFEGPTARRSLEEAAAGEAEAWCRTTERVLVPMRDADRENSNDWGRREALAIYDRVGADCTHSLWLEFGRQMSPVNPEYDYAQ